MSEKLIPKLVQIELTSRCNSKCVYCRRTQSNGFAIGDMSFALYKHIIKKSPEGCHIKFSGAGEPTLYKRLPEAMSFARKNGHKAWLITNGSMLSGSLLNDIKGCCDKIDISVDDCEEDGYESIRQGLSFDVLVQNVFAVRDSGVRYGIILVLTKDNIDRKREIIDYWESIVGKGRIKTTPEIEQAQPDNEAYVDGVPPKCRHGWYRQYAMIRFNGDMILCCRDIGNYVIGNIAHKSVVQLYNSKRFNQIRAAMKSGIGFPALCAQCNIEMDTKRYELE